MPAKIVWRSKEVEQIMETSQELYHKGGFETYLGGGRQDRELLLEAVQNGKGRTLKDVLPPNLYEQFSALNQKYANGDNSLDLLRPFVAIQELRRRAMAQQKLTADGGITRTMERLAKQHDVKIQSLTHRDDRPAREGVTDLGAIPRERDIPCFEQQLGRLEAQIEEAAVRANAWATGDISTLRASFAGQADASTDACRDFMRLTRPLWEGTIESEKRGYETLRDALNKNASTVLMMPIGSILQAEGVVAKLRGEGYQVEEP